MSGERVAIVDTGVANIASLEAAFRRLDLAPELTTSAERIEAASYAVLPGVGAFGAGMERLEADGLVESIGERIAAGEPTLAVCLGMQLLATGSEESAGTEGLGVVDVDVRRFSEGVRVPQFGWNEVRAADDCQLLTTGYAYFANSYCITDAPDGWRAATAEYGGSFVGAMERGCVLACQFHPELSGEWGHRLLERWIRRGGESC